MEYKNLLIALGFSPKENAVSVFSKKYLQADNYCLEVDFENETINYGDKIKAESKTTQNFSQPENFVVLECVNRLLEKGYTPEKIVLEKIYPTGHGTSGRLDILVIREEQPYLMIECKTYGEEFEKELKNTQKNGGQLFTYFQQDTKAELLMLYTSKLSDNGIVSDSKIIKIEDDFRNAGSVKNAFERWDKKFLEKGFWENPPYNFQLKKFTKADLKELTEEEGRKLFHGFATILRKHSVSDKPNAFNVIFNLFLAKLWDEQKRDDQELEFQWRDNDDPVDFQVRLYDLHKNGLWDFLKKEIEGIENNFDAKTSIEEQRKAKKKFLKINKLFDIKTVLDDNDFEQNHRVLVEVVKMLQKYQIRYPRKQKYLSEFFELLLTTGLKQEAGQYFTPPVITRFIIKSLPLPAMIKQEVNNPTPKLPAVIDYAAGSGHFITEILEEFQDIIETLDTTDFYPKAQKEVASWKADQYNWAARYVYGIEKDYRLVKVAKVGCYFYGDGLAQVVHGDGLDSFEKSKSYIGLLKDNANKPQFSVVVSNPPYSVNDCKDDLEYIGSQNDFELYKSLTDRSKEIECLFVERTRHLLKDGGIAGIVLPNSMLSNEKIYTKAREIILQYFEIVSITELGSNTFMATGTNTVVLFLRKRNEKRVNEIKDIAYNIAENYPKTFEDKSVNGIEKPVKEYLDYTGETEINPEKFYYFVLNYHQKTVIVKTGEKDAEKRFLGYEFSNRRGSEGMHPIQRGKTLDECTKLYNENNFEDETKASSYIYKAFAGDYETPIHESMKNNVFRVHLIDMLTFDRENFIKNISTAVKKKVEIKSKWDIVSLNKIVSIVRGASPRPIREYITEDKNGINWIKIGDVKPNSKYITETREKITVEGADKSRYVKRGDFILSNSMSFGRPYIMEIDGCIHDGWLLLSDFSNNLNKDYLYYVLSDSIIQEQFIDSASGGTSVDNLNIDKVSYTKIPLPPKEIQEKIVSEIEVWESKEIEAKEVIKNGKNKIEQLFTDAYNKSNIIFRLSDDIFSVSIGKRVIEADIAEKGTIPVYSANVFVPFGYIDKYLIEDFSVPSVLWGIDGDWMVNYMPANKPFYPTDHCGILRIKSNEILPKYLAWVLNKEGIAQNFSRTLRASIDRIKGLSVKVPPLSDQQKIVSEIEEIETQIAEAQKVIDKIPAAKNAVLKKYL